MHLGPSVAREFVKELVELIKPFTGKADIGVAPPFISIPHVAEVIRDKKTELLLCAQNCHWEDSGAFTGEVSPSMLKEAGVEYVIIGHSERREIFKETDRMINMKLKALKRNGLKAILCVGEKLEEREKGLTEEIIKKQIEEGLDGIEVDGIVIAYEPVWAIGTGKTATPEMAEEVHSFIKELIRKAHGQEVKVIYGGSVKPENIKSLIATPDIEGALVGGASIQVKSFYEIIKNSLE